MALINCPECGRQVSDRAIECPGCGYPIQANIRESVSDETKVIEQNYLKSDNNGNGQNDIDDRADSLTCEQEKTIENEELYLNEESSDKEQVGDNNLVSVSEESGKNENTDDRKNIKRFIIISSVVLAVVALVLVFIFVILPKISESKEEQNDTNSSYLNKNSDVNEEEQRKNKELEIHGKSVYTAAQAVASKFYAKNMVPGKSENVQEYCRQVYEISEINQNKNAIAYIRFKSPSGDSGHDAYTVDEIIYSDDGDTYIRFYNGNWDHFDKSDLIGYGAPEWIIINAGTDISLSTSTPTPTPTSAPTPTSTPIPTATPSPIPTSAPEYKIDTSNSDKWAKKYLERLLEFEESEDENIYDGECRFVYIDDDDIPELCIDFGFTYMGAYLFTIENSNKNGDIGEIDYHSGSIDVIPGKNVIFVSGGRMGNYYDYVYDVENGFKQLFSAEYDDFENITYGWYIDEKDKKHEICDNSLWDIYKREFDRTNAVGIDTSGKVYTYRECVEYLKGLLTESELEEILNPQISDYVKAEYDKVKESQYILEGSGFRYLEEKDFYGMDSDDCRFARNEIYARHGLKFKSDDLRSYFNSKDWYYPSTDSVDQIESEFNEYERENIIKIKDYEEDGCPYSGYSKNKSRSVTFTEWCEPNYTTVNLEYVGEHEGYITLNIYEENDYGEILTDVSETYFFREKNDLKGIVYYAFDNSSVIRYISYKIEYRPDYLGEYRFVMDFTYCGQEYGLLESKWAYTHVG